MQRIHIKGLTPDDVNENYVRWLNDKTVNQYLECRYQVHTLESVKDHIRNLDKSSMLFGIRTVRNELIGTISLGWIDKHNGFAYIGLMIGNKEYWGKGYGLEAINTVKDFAFENIGIRKLIAGICECNKKSIATFESAGFKLAGCLNKNRLVNKVYVDELIYEIIKQEKILN